MAIFRKINIMEKDENIDKLGGQDGGSYSETGSSAHYKDSLIEFIDDIELQYGTVIAYLTCCINEEKYRKRAGKKEGVPANKDLTKASWYNACGQYLRLKIDRINSDSGENVDQEGYNRAYFTINEHIAYLFKYDFEEIPTATFIKPIPLGDIVNSILNK